MGIVIIAVLVVIFLLLWAIIDIVPQSEARVMERLGIFRAVWGAGIHLRFPVLDRCAIRVDLREQVMELPKTYHSGSESTYNVSENWDGFNKGYDRIKGRLFNNGAFRTTETSDSFVAKLSKSKDYTFSLRGEGESTDKIKFRDKFNDSKTFNGKWSGRGNINYTDYTSDSVFSDYQGVITKDNVVMHVDAAVFFQITDPKMYAYGMVQPRFALQKLTITTLRNIIGTLELDETLCSRDLINSKLRATLDEATDSWGIKITRVEIEEILPPPDIQEAMHAQAYAERMRRAVILAAEGDKQAKILEAEGEAEYILKTKQAEADSLNMLNENAPTDPVIRLKAIQGMEKVADGQATKIIIPSEMQGLVGLANGITEGITPSTKPVTK